MDRLDETPLRDGAEVDVSDEEDEGRADAPLGVHRSGRVVVMEPARLRGRWSGAAELFRVQFVERPRSLPRALREPGRPQAIALALTREAKPARRRALVAALGRVELAGQRVVIDVRRCDLSTAIGLLTAGFILCADDEEHRGSAPRAAVSQATMADELADAAARRRLAKTIGASAVSDQHGLSANEHRVLRGLMDFPQLKRLAKRTSLAPSTVRSHAARIRSKACVTTMDGLVYAAEAAAFEAVYELGRLKL